MSSLPHQSTPKRVIKACYKAGLFMRYYQGDPMKPICPNCHSAHVIENIETSTQGLTEHLCSPKLFVGLGVSVCKYYKINPMIGMVAGSAIATVINLAQQGLMQPPLIRAAVLPRYLCRTCQHTFNV